MSSSYRAQIRKKYNNHKISGNQEIMGEGKKNSRRKIQWNPKRHKEAIEPLKIPKNLQLMLKVRENYCEIAMLIENQRKNSLRT